MILENQEVILLHGIQKTGNKTLNNSFKKIKNVIFTRHILYHDEISEEKAKSIFQLNKQVDIKIIMGIREPLERIISHKWQNLKYPHLNNNEPISTHVNENYDAFLDIVTCKKKNNGSYVYADVKNWIDVQVEKVFGINIFEYPFDKEKGYMILEEGNVSIFCYRLDKLNELEAEMGKFCGISNFKLINDNMSTDKEYYFLYKQYLSEVTVDKRFFEKLMKSKGVTHFYTAEECKKMREKWNKCLVESK